MFSSTASLRMLNSSMPILSISSQAADRMVSSEICFFFTLIPRSTPFPLFLHHTKKQGLCLTLLDLYLQPLASMLYYLTPLDKSNVVR
ncbi:hypothetical protein D3C73_768750 [compost metagenome]